MIKCRCRKVIFDGIIFKIRVAQFSKGYMNLKCPQCKTWLEGLNAKLLTGEIKRDVDFSKEAEHYEEGKRRVKDNG